MNPAKHILNEDPSEISLSFLFDILSRDNKIYLFSEMEKLGITFHEYQFLSYLAHEKTAIQEELAKLFRKNESTITRALKKLEDKDLIIREQDETNRRKNIVSLNEKGLEVVRYIEVADDYWEKEILNIFSVEDQIKLKKSLKKIIATSIKKNENKKDEMTHIISGL